MTAPNQNWLGHPAWRQTVRSEVWQEALKHFDPCIMKTDEGLILRSGFGLATTLSQAHEFGKTLLERLNGALGVSRQAGMVRLEKVVEFLPDGSPYSM